MKRCGYCGGHAFQKRRRRFCCAECAQANQRHERRNAYQRRRALVGRAR